MARRTQPLDPRHFDEEGRVRPDQQDHAAVEKDRGPSPTDASTKDMAERWRLAQANKLIRLHEQGLLPLEKMREMDKLARRR